MAGVDGLPRTTFVPLSLREIWHRLCLPSTPPPDLLISRRDSTTMLICGPLPSPFCVTYLPLDSRTRSLRSSHGSLSGLRITPGQCVVTRARRKASATSNHAARQGEAREKRSECSHTSDAVLLCCASRCGVVRELS